MTKSRNESSQRGQEVVLRPPRGRARLPFRELWAYRELLYFLTWRDIKVRYKQTAFGAAWAVIQPLALMVVFAGLFGQFAHVAPGSEDIPAPLFFYAGLVPWTLFASSLTSSSQSVVAGATLVSKVYFPRLIMPIAATGAFLIDFVIAMVILGVMMIAYGIAPTPTMLLLPAYTAVALITALGIGIGMSALNAKYRDIAYAIPFVVQFLFFLTPVMYPATSAFVPTWLRPLYGLNPMVGVIEGFRWTLLHVGPRPGAMALISTIGAIVLLWLATMNFQRLERSFADVI